MEDPILRNAYVGGWILGLLLGGLSVLGAIRYPHWIWAGPIVASVLALVANQLVRAMTGRRVAVVVLGMLTLALLVGAGVLAGTAVHVAH